MTDILQNCSSVVAKENDLIILQGEIGNCLFVILSGKASVYIDFTKTGELAATVDDRTKDKDMENKDENKKEANSKLRPASVSTLKSGGCLDENRKVGSQGKTSQMNGLLRGKRSGSIIPPIINENIIQSGDSQELSSGIESSVDTTISAKPIIRSDTCFSRGIYDFTIKIPPRRTKSAPARIVKDHRKELPKFRNLAALGLNKEKLGSFMLRYGIFNFLIRILDRS